MRISLLLGAAACLVAAALAGSAVAHRSAHDTDIVILATEDAGNGQVYVVGRLDSDTRKCIGNRRVRLYYHYVTDPTPTLVDRELSSEQGMFAASGPAENDEHDTIQSGLLKVVGEHRGTRHHPVRCHPDTAVPIF
jgi:hypothetical protein